MKALDAVVQQKPLLSHPFYAQWNAGTLSRNALQEYAKQYYHLEAAFPRFLSAIHSRCPDRKTRKILLENLVDEELGKPHAELWLQFCAALGVSRASVLNAKLLPETKKAIAEFQSLAEQNDFVGGVAALYAYESQIPGVAKTKRLGLKKFYGISGKKAVEFFSVHEKADVWHSATEREIMQRHAKNSVRKKIILSSAERGRDALHTLLDGVYKRYCMNN